MLDCAMVEMARWKGLEEKAVSSMIGRKHREKEAAVEENIHSLTKHQVSNPSNQFFLLTAHSTRNSSLN